MFITTIPNDKPQTEIGQAVAQEVEIKTIPERPVLDYCLCDLGLSVCDYVQPAFYGGSNKYQNDYTSFFVNKIDSSDTIQFFVVNKSDNSEIELTDLIAANYGVYSEDDNHIGVDIDFTTLKASYPSLSKIYFRVEHTVFNSPLIYETHTFHLIEWNEVRANGTVRIDLVQNGFIESGNDYGNLDWRRSLRIKGKFGNFTPELSRDDYMDGNRVIRQIQDSIIEKYTLETELLPLGIMKMLALNDMLANEIIISDYNLQNGNYKGISVVPENINTNYYEKNPNGSYEIEFKARKENNIKHNR